MASKSQKGICMKIKVGDVLKSNANNQLDLIVLDVQPENAIAHVMYSDGEVGYYYLADLDDVNFEKVGNIQTELELMLHRARVYLMYDEYASKVGENCVNIRKGR